MKNKRIIASLAALALLFSLCATAALAAGEKAEVLVSVSDGNLDNGVELAWQKVTVTDIDGDSALTVNDALYAAHEAGYKGGAEAGYASAVTEYGISLNKLWGVDNGGSYGYCVNDASALSLSDPISDGDRIYAYAYADLAGWSDTYAYFDLASVEADSGDTVTLTLSVVGFDAEWNPYTAPFEGAEILVDGKPTGVVTGADGKASLTLSGDGRQVISASAESAVLVPPVCVAEVDGGGFATIWAAVGTPIIAALALLATVKVVKKNKNR